MQEVSLGQHRVACPMPPYLQGTAMTYEQIKNKTVPPAKRTAQAVQKWLARLPEIPLWVSYSVKLFPAMVFPLQAILKNPTPYLVGAAGAAAVTVFLGPLAIPFVAPAISAITFGMVAIAICVVLGAFITIYEHRVQLAKAMVVLLEKL
jgi:hypothetical protein